MLGLEQDFCQCLIMNLKTNSFISVVSPTMADLEAVLSVPRGDIPDSHCISAAVACSGQYKIAVA